MLTPLIHLRELADLPGGRDVLSEYLPGALASVEEPWAQDVLVGAFMRVEPQLRDDPARQQDFWDAVDALVAPMSHRNRPARPPRDTRPGTDAPAASATWSLTGESTRWGTIEITLVGPAEGNPFRDMELTANFTCGDRSWTAGGVYDGDGRYLIRVLAEEEGFWRFTTSSSEPALDGVTGQLTVGAAAPGAHGPVRVHGMHFSRADGTGYRPWGTTAYAWNHQSVAMQELTLGTLAQSPFTKLRMCLFPKHYVFNHDEPELFPFPRLPDGSFDLKRFDTDFFRRLDDQVQALGRLGIEADLILFHPYDHWGFADLGPDVDEQVTRYVVRRLAGYPNVWFSLANEYDLMTGKSAADWDRIGETIVEEDPHGHLVSIHNWVEFFDHGRPWISHASVQRGDVEHTTTWRETWSKPVVVDECGYEGDIEHGWGNLSGQELLRRIWVGAIGGGYVGHGETYWSVHEQLWWSKGGELRGESHRRLAFLDEIVAAAPGGVLEPQASFFDVPWAGDPDRYLVSYHGAHRPRERHVLLPPGRWVAEVLDAWECTVTPVPGEHESFVHVPLPVKPYQAVRVTRVHGSSLP